nr:hypothetical protein [uncultured Flavobacterium sp.]
MQIIKNDSVRLVFSDEELVQIEDLAAVNYSPEKIAKYLDVDKQQFMKLWYNKDSDVRMAYDKGQLTSEFLINQKQLELAKSGNITAAQVFFKESQQNKIANIRNQVLFGHDNI